jgi:hypothetical protein
LEVIKVQQNAGTYAVGWHDPFYCTGHTAAINSLEENVLVHGNACNVRTKSIK